MESVSLRESDFSRIDGWSADNHRVAHFADRAWLNAEVESISRLKPQRKIAVLTHYSPSADKQSIDSTHTRSKISSSFMTDLSKEACWTSNNVKAWAFGHSHFNCDFEVPLKFSR